MVNTNGIPGTISLASSSMTSSPISMLSSFEDFANTPSSVIPPPIPASNAPGNIHGLSLIQVRHFLLPMYFMGREGEGSCVILDWIYIFPDATRVSFTFEDILT